MYHQHINYLNNQSECLQLLFAGDFIWWSGAEQCQLTKSLLQTVGDWCSLHFKESLQLCREPACSTSVGLPWARGSKSH